MEMENKILCVENLENVFCDCLDEDVQDDSIIAKGVVHKFAFNKEKLEENKDKIFDMLMELPTQFRKSDGGGWSFLCACNDKDGEQWTGLHLNMEKLFALGMAIGKVDLLLPQELWGALPGSVPYYIINDV